MKLLLALFISWAIFFGCRRQEVNPDDLITWKVFTKSRPGDSIFAFYVPSGFTPNGDGINEYREPQFILLNSSDYYISVFDKTGSIVFKSDKPDRFDGKGNNKEVLPQQTFEYYIKATDFWLTTYTSRKNS